MSDLLTTAILDRWVREGRISAAQRRNDGEWTVTANVAADAVVSALAVERGLTTFRSDYELADFEPSDGHLHNCGVRADHGAVDPTKGCECAGILYCVAMDLSIEASQSVAATTAARPSASDESSTP